MYIGRRVNASAAFLTLFIPAVLFARPATNRPFVQNIQDPSVSTGAQSDLLHESSAFRITLKRYPANFTVPLFRAAVGTITINVRPASSEKRPRGDGKAGEVVRGRRGSISYLPARGIGGGHTTAALAGASVSLLGIEVSPGPEGPAPIPAAEAKSARAEQSRQEILGVHPSKFRRSNSDKQSNISSSMLKVQDAEVKLLYVAKKASLSKMSRSSVWFVLAGEGTISVGEEAYRVEPDSLLSLPPGSTAITVDPASVSGSVKPLRLVIVEHKKL